MYLQVGYGLEGVLPDALCKRIISEQITPRFKAGDFDGGLTAGVQSIIAATKGEYKGTGTTVAERRGIHGNSAGGSGADYCLLIFVVIFVDPAYPQPASGPAASITGVAVGRVAVFPGGGGFWWRRVFGGGGGGFSGGGGSFGGGGAGGSW